ncbi:1-pyrroline-5-carboxylate dehydrogenase 1 [Planctomycetes bacterium Pla163]|uniref:L-glutamate gamma-semialdehyde dehydrogenase n=1 Tax=Rohdeia mirabilis TaxID=2528008 RepID=A0A518CZU0_9BACT|nr:1-pyrroline-5-carboxylate dehydrogenase 1 [Planctomycetes bacterium Pla163]
MTHGEFRVPVPVNEPVRAYAPGSKERASIEAELDRQASEVVEIPVLVGGEEVRTGDTFDVVMPHDHGHVLAKVHKAGPTEVARAIEAAQTAKYAWQALPFEARAGVLLKSAELLAGPWRDRINASTMLCQSKTVHQAEIDAACELIDFWRFNCQYAEAIHAEQPISSPGCWNRVEHRPLDGFVFAITPFNFTSIAANLPSAPALMGNTTLWKPSETATLSNWYTLQLMREAGLPDGVINFLPGDGPTIGGAVLADPRLSGLHFTGSTPTFRHLWRQIGENLANYKAYPRIVGETGGKDFVFAHASADVESLVVALLRGAFEYQGQKCSAASRAYVPKSLWPTVKARLAEETAKLRMGDPRDFRNFLGAVIDARAFAKHKDAIDAARSAKDARIVIGGEYDDSRGYFVSPTVIEADSPDYDTMLRELFGPILTVHPYADDSFEVALEHCCNGSEFALTGAIFARDRAIVSGLTERLRYAAGNFYVNDKPTGAVVGQQPFGGTRASGTNDKAGSRLNLERWVSQRTIKETFDPPKDWRYPFLG